MILFRYFKRFYAVLCLAALGSLAASRLVASNITGVSGISIIAGTPSPGASVTVQWNWTTDSAFNNPHYIIMVGTTCLAQNASSGNQWTVVGDSCGPQTGNVGPGCDMTDNQAAGAHISSDSITIPSTLTPGSTYYIIVAMKDYNVYLNPNLDASTQNCMSFNVPLPPPTVSISKVAEGNSAAAGGEVVYTIYYYFANTNNPVITDLVDTANLNIVSIFNGGVLSGSTITWSFPGFIGTPQSGFVSFRAQVKPGTSTGTIIHNTANASSGEVSTVTSNDATVAVGQVNLSLAKSSNATALNAGDTFTYTMIYSSSGTSLVEYQNFDAASLPPGWTIMGASNLGTWSTGNSYLEQTDIDIGGGTSPYPKAMDTGMTPVHDAVYLFDMYIDGTQPNTFDAVFMFNSDATATLAYQLRFSSDTNNMAFDHEGINIAVVSQPNGYNVTTDTWYSFRVEVFCTNLRAKVWPRGQDEPSGWGLQTTSALYSGTGIAGFQANDGRARFDNLKIFSLAGGSGVTIWDTVPAGALYVSCSGGNSCSQSGGVVTWNVGGSCASGGGVQMVVRADPSLVCSVPIVNVAAIDSTDPPPAVYSNSVTDTAQGPCSTPTVTPTYTFSFTPSFTRTPSPTLPPTGSPTNTATPSPSYTQSPTQLPTGSVTQSATQSPTATQTATLQPSGSATHTATASPIYSPTATPTYSATATASVTRSATLTATPYLSPTITPTFSVSPTRYIPGVAIEFHGFYPNPFDKEGSVYFSLRADAEVNMNIYNVAGEIIHKRSVSLAAGKQILVWKGENQDGGRCASGVYVLHVKATNIFNESGEFWSHAVIAR